MRNGAGVRTVPRVEIRKRTSLVLLFAGLLGSLLAWFYLTQTSEITTAIIRLHKLAGEHEFLRRENASLRYQIAVLRSSARVQEEAKKLGFTPAQGAEYLPLLSYQSLTPRLLPGDDASTSSPAPASFWSRLWDQIWVLITGSASGDQV